VVVFTFIDVAVGKAHFDARAVYHLYFDYPLLLDCAEDGLLLLVYLRLVLGCAGNFFPEAQFCEYAVVESALLLPAHVKRLVIIFQAFPMTVEFSKAVFSKLLDYFVRTPCDLPAFKQAMLWPPIFSLT